MDLKERLLRGEISSIAWLPTKDMWADMLTKEMKLPEALENILTRNVMNIKNNAFYPQRKVGMVYSISVVTSVKSLSRS